MPLVYQQNINGTSKLGLWQIAEPEPFFLAHVPLQREITHPHKRLQHLAGRYLLKALFPDFPYELIRIADTRKPFLENEAYHFSISHSGDYAAVLVSRDHRVGVDVEIISAKVGSIVHKFLTLQEQQLLQNLPLDNVEPTSEQMLTAAWSIKESLFKWQAGSDTDFKKHLRIHNIVLGNESGHCACSILKQAPIQLDTHFRFFKNSCLSWVLKPAAEASW